MNINECNNIKLPEIPSIATGKVIPPMVEYNMIKEEYEEEIRKADIRRQWLISIFTVVASGIVTVIINLIFR